MPRRPNRTACPVARRWRRGHSHEIRVRRPGAPGMRAGTRAPSVSSRGIRGLPPASNRRGSSCRQASSGGLDRNQPALCLLLDHPVDQAPGPERAGIDVDVVEVATRVLVDCALLGFYDDLVFQKNAPTALKDLARHPLLVNPVV